MSAPNSYRRNYKRVAAMLREWSDRDLALGTDTRVREKSLGYIAATVIEDLLKRSSGPSMPALITAEQLAEVKDQCEAGLQVEHECPAMFALAAIYAELFVDSGTTATMEKE